MGVVDLRTYRDSSATPLLILVDPQLEYQCEDRALRLDCADEAIANCQALLSFARASRFPVAFVRWIQKGKFFGHMSAGSGWIDGLGPRGSDMIFDRDMPSCYASRDFADMMEQGGGSNAVIAGFTGTIACLSTIIDAFHRGHRVMFISDASASHQTVDASHADAHRAAVGIARLYCPVETTARWIARHRSNEPMKVGA